jgi:homocysteine S-methyltransferase
LSYRHRQLAEQVVPKKKTAFPMSDQPIIHDLLQPFLDRAGVVILDGALATELERRGANLGDALWSARLLLDDPDLIRQVHHDYFDAGADVATTASYQASLPELQRRGLTMQQAEDVLRLSVRLAQEAREQFWQSTPPSGRPRPLVAASIGCFGASLHDGSEYRGDYGLSAGQLMDWHRPRLEILATSGADLLACETIPCLEEAEALVRLLDVAAGVPAWISFSCRDARHLCHGETFAQAVALAAGSPRVLAVGVNCTAPRHVRELLESAAGLTTKPLLAYPNIGEGWDPRGRTWQSGPEVVDWGEAARQWHKASARLIGGCCRTTPETIRQIRRGVGQAFQPDTSGSKSG